MSCEEQPPGEIESTVFFRHWFAGLVQGLEALDARGQEIVLRACGRACADSYTAQLFQRAREASADLDGFLAALAERFPDAAYERLSPGEIRVRYSACACDLVTLGLVRSPLLCRCSVHNLRENFERALGVPVGVTLECAILQGAPRCSFLVHLG